jgi:hypothetical protein
LKIIALFDNFTVQHVSGMKIQWRTIWYSKHQIFFTLRKILCSRKTGCSSFQLMHSAEICSTEPDLAKPDSMISEIGGSRISRNSDNLGEMTTTNPDDWRTPLVYYLENSSQFADRKVQRQALKYVVLDNTLYHRTIDGLLLKFLGSDQSKIAVGEVHEAICGTHQSAKWLLHRVGFYWLTMLNDYFRYYKGCELCQNFRDVQLPLAAMLHSIIKPWSFCGWALDFIGQIHPSSPKGHRFVLVTMDYFIK